MKKLLKTFKTLSLSVLIVFCVVAIALVVLAVTPWGLKLSVSALEKAYPTLTIEKVEGTLFQANLEKIVFSQEGLRLSADSISYSVANIAPMDRFISVAYIASQGLHLEVESSNDQTDAAPTQTNPSSSTDFVLPVGLEVASLSLTDTDIAVNDMRAEIGSFETALKAHRSKITVGQTALKTLALTLPPAPAESPKSPAQTINAFFESALVPRLSDIKLPIAFELTRFSLDNLTVNGQKFVDTLGLGFSFQNARATLKTLTVSTPFVTASGQVDLTTQGNWPLRVKLNFDRADIEHFGRLSGSVSLEGGLFSPIAVKADVATPQALSLTGTLEASQPGLPVDLSVSGQVTLPQSLIGNTLAGDVTMDVDELKLTGNFHNWTLTNRTRATFARFPKTDLDFKIQGRQLSFDYALGLEQTAAKLRTSGSALLNEQGLKLNTQTQVDLTDIKTFLAAYKPDVAHPLAQGKLPLKAATDIESADFSRFQADISEAKISGQLDAKPLAIDLSASINEKFDVTVKKLQAHLAQNRIELQAHYIDQVLWAQGLVNATQLDAFDPKLQGTLSGQLSASGKLDNLDFKADVSGSSLAYDTYFAQKLHVTADLLNLGKKPSKVTLTASKLTANDQKLDNVALTLAGTESRHTLTLDVTGPKVDARLTWQAKINEALSLWQSTLTQGQVRLDKTQWKAISKPDFSLNLQAPSLTLGKHCWKETQSQAQVCINDSTVLAQAGQADIRLLEIPLSLAQAQAPVGVKLTGVINGQVRARWSQPAIEHMTIASDFDASGAGIKTRVADKPVKVALKTALLSARLEKNRLTAEATLAVNPNSPLKATLSVDDPSGQAELKAQVLTQSLDLKDFSGLVASLTPVTQTSGFVSADLTLAGSGKAPRVTGNIDIASLKLNGPTIPLDMQPSDFEMNFEADTSVFHGTLVSSEGPLTFEGKAQWQNIDSPTAYVRVKGNNFRIVSSPYVKALVTPDITVSVDEKRIALSGKIEIPEALLSAESIPESAVSVSEDEVIVDAQMNPIVKENGKPLKIESSLAVTLGSDVRVKAFGLAAQLAGTVTVTQTNDTLGLRGTLTIPEGRFQAYGQDLLIRKGSFIFAGPVNDPTVELVAERNPDAVEDDVTVGIRVSGSVSRMHSEIFSDPTMDQASQLSYLLRGRGLETNTEDNSMLSSALLTVGLSQTGQLISGIGNALMIRDLGVSTEGVGDNSQVVVSGYVLPDLQVKYAMSIFDSLSTLTLRYRLMPKLFVEASSGVNQAVEVLYNFEF